MKISNDQGMGAAVVDCVAPFLGEVKEFLPLFEEPNVQVGDGAIIASIQLSSLRADVPGEAVEGVLRAARKLDLSSRVSAEPHRIAIEIYGFVIF